MCCQMALGKGDRAVAAAFYKAVNLKGAEYSTTKTNEQASIVAVNMVAKCVQRFRMDLAVGSVLVW